MSPGDDTPNGFSRPNSDLDDDDLVFEDDFDARVRSPNSSIIVRSIGLCVFVFGITSYVVVRQYGNAQIAEWNQQEAAAKAHRANLDRILAEKRAKEKRKWERLRKTSEGNREKAIAYKNEQLEKRQATTRRKAR